MKTSITAAQIIALSLMIVTQASAKQPTNFTPAYKERLASTETIYKSMSTSQLQKEVERRSNNGEIIFDMGLELMKRWSNS